MLSTSLLLVFILTMTSFVEGTIFTSSAKIKELVTLEQPLLDALQSYISSEYDKLKTLSGFLVDRSKVSVSDSIEALQRQTEHPNGAYKVIQFFVQDWQNIVNANPGFAVLIADKSPQLPTATDLAGARSALIRLQDVYDLSVRDMYEGNYLGFRGPNLTLSDAIEIGKQGFTDGTLNESIAWLEFALEQLRKEEARDGPTERTRKLTVFTLGLLGRVYNYIKNRKKALELYEASSALDPSSSEVLQLGTELANPPQYEQEKWPFHDSTKQLCSRDPAQRVAELKPFHVCRYTWRERLYYSAYKEEVLSVSPYAIVVYDVITNDEIEALKETARDSMSVGTVGIIERKVGFNVRTSNLGWAWDRESPVVAHLSQKVKAITGLEINHMTPDVPFSSEPFQVVNYGLGGHYDVHTDSDSAIEKDESVFPNAGPRLATFLIYLTDVARGGGTVFPAAGISVAPIKGMALFWYNYAPALADTDYLTYHAGCPVVIGHKWVANKWIRTYGNMQRRPCGLSPNSTQQDIQNSVRTLRTLT